MKIIDVICSAGRTGFYFDDQRAIKAGAKSDGAAYVGEPKTPGFTSVRQPSGLAFLNYRRPLDLPVFIPDF